MTDTRINLFTFVNMLLKQAIDTHPIQNSLEKTMFAQHLVCKYQFLDLDIDTAEEEAEYQAYLESLQEAGREEY